MRTFCAAVSAVNGGSGGRFIFSSCMSVPKRIAIGQCQRVSASDQRRFDGDVPVRCSRIGTHLVGRLDKSLRRRALHPRQAHVEASRQAEGAPFGTEIDLGPEGGAFSLAARLYVSLPGMERATAQRLVEAAHQVCPYSRATHGNIAVETTLV